MEKRSIELWVGLFVLAGILALAMLSFKVSNLSSAEVQDGYLVNARFENIGGLKTRAPITMAGVRIGRVSQISFDKEKYQAVVAMNIDGRYRNIPDDSSASILTSGLLGEQYISISPGGSEEYLEAGSEVLLTQSALVLENLIGQLMVTLSGKDDEDSKK